MKKLVCLLIISCTILLAGCFETTQEITINKDGSGLFSNLTDLSNMLALLKQMSGDDTARLANTDTTLSLSGLADSIGGLTPHQKEIISRGTMRLTLNMDDEKLLIRLNLPFEKLSDIEMLKQVLPDITETALKKLPGTGQMPPGIGNADTSAIKTFDDFYDISFTDRVISKTLNKDKYAKAKDGDFMKSLQQLSDMGSPVKANYIIDLPRPAKKVEGSAVKLSDDKMKVTIAVTSDDFFNDPSKFEYHIEY